MGSAVFSLCLSLPSRLLSLSRRGVGRVRAGRLRSRLHAVEELGRRRG